MWGNGEVSASVSNPKKKGGSHERLPPFFYKIRGFRLVYADDMESSAV